MGDTYKRLEVKQTSKGYRETLGYIDSQDGIYRFRLLNNKLQEWDYLQPNKCKDNCSNDKWQINSQKHLVRDAFIGNSRLLIG